MRLLVVALRPSRMPARASRAEPVAVTAFGFFFTCCRSPAILPQRPLGRRERTGYECKRHGASRPVSVPIRGVVSARVPNLPEGLRPAAYFPLGDGAKRPTSAPTEAEPRAISDSGVVLPSDTSTIEPIAAVRAKVPSTEMAMR